MFVTHSSSTVSPPRAALNSFEVLTSDLGASTSEACDGPAIPHPIERNASSGGSPTGSGGGLSVASGDLRPSLRGLHGQRGATTTYRGILDRTDLETRAQDGRGNRLLARPGATSPPEIHRPESLGPLTS